MKKVGMSAQFGTVDDVWGRAEDLPGTVLGQVHIIPAQPQPHHVMDHWEEKRYVFLQAKQKIGRYAWCDIKEKCAVPTGKTFEPIRYSLGYRSTVGEEGINTTGQEIPKGYCFWLQTQGPIMRDGKKWRTL